MKKRAIVIPEWKFQFLHDHYGNHTRAAEALGFAQRSWLQIRQKGCAAKYIIRAIDNLITLIQLGKDPSNKAA